MPERGNKFRNSPTDGPNSLRELTCSLCEFATGVVAPDNATFFKRIRDELPIRLHRYPSGTEFNGWQVPQKWSVQRAALFKDGVQLFDGTVHSLGVGSYSKSFEGDLDWEDLKPHLVTNPDLPEAFVYHCMWQYRPWDADWALCVPYEAYKTFGPGKYRVELVTRYEPGEMLVADYEHRGRSDRTIVFNAHTCHPGMANDDFAGLAVLVRLFQWLRGRKTWYTYRLVLGPEHLGTVFYLKDRNRGELQRFVGGAFSEMPGTSGPVKVASSFLGDQTIDLAFRNAAKHRSGACEFVSWRQGAGNDETVWEAPGYEIPFVEVSRCEDLLKPFREYHTSLDTADLMDEAQLEEFLDVFKGAVEILERNSTLHRKFDGLICLSNPKYDLYMERPDPAVEKDLPADSEKWGYLLDCFLRYMDGSMSVLEIAEKHDLPFDRLYNYLLKFQEKGLIEMKFALETGRRTIGP